MERHILRLNWQEFPALVREKPGVIIPIGTLEAHGCTNLGTDITIPEYLAEKLAERLDLLIAPTINYGITRTLLPYPGSMTVGEESFKAYVFDVAESLIEAGFEHIIFMNGHGGHIDELAEIARKLWRKTGGRSIVVHWWQMCADITKKILGEEGGHAGLDETYMVLTADETLVKRELYRPEMAFLVRSGTTVYPQAGALLQYEKGKGLPRFNKREARKYANAIVEEIASFISNAINSWKREIDDRFAE